MTSKPVEAKGKARDYIYEVPRGDVIFCKFIQFLPPPFFSTVHLQTVFFPDDKNTEFF